MDFSKNNRMYSLLGQRGTFGLIVSEMAEKNDNIVCVSADLTKTSGLERFATSFPNRFYNVGIAEQSALAFAAGLADYGKNPFVTTFANFAALRANEFVRHFMSYMGSGIKLVGMGSGFSMELFGNTHYGLEDISVLRSMPNVVILSPCDCMEVAKCVEYCVDYEGAVYLRLSGKANNPIVNKSDYVFEVGKGVVLYDGEDIVLYSTGTMVYYALKVAELLENEGFSVAVINMHTITPIDTEIIEKYKDCPYIFTIEEHSDIGGLGSSIAEILSLYNKHGRLTRIGTRKEYLKAGTYEYMLEMHELTVEGILKKVLSNSIMK